LATTPVLMKMTSRGALKLEDRLGDILEELSTDPKSAVTIAHLLAHQSGLPDYRPFYRRLQHVEASKRKSRLNRYLCETPLIYPIGEKTLYSDLGFMFLRWVIERVAGTALDRVADTDIFQPLGLTSLFFVDSSGAPMEKTFAATEDCPWRQGVVCGKVHDENAFVVGGVDGHAGLFGTADQVHALLHAFLSIYHGEGAGVDLPNETMRRFLNYGEKGGRALGFDRPSARASSSGAYFSENSVGHLGFTGVSFWMDLDRRIIVVLLTNRVHPTRSNESIKAFRPVLHDSIMRNLLKAENS
jgi:CubicO group peptidase (beta-lactamase class C family)